MKKFIVLLCTSILLSSTVVKADELTDKQASLKTLQNQPTILENKIKTLENQKIEIQSRKEAVDKTNQQVQEVVKYLEETKKIKEKIVTDLEEEISNIEKEIKNREAELNPIDDFIGMDLLKSIDGKLNLLDSQVTRTQKELTEAKREEKDAIDKYNKATSLEYRELTSEIEATETQIQDTNEELNSTKSSITKTKAEIANLEAIKAAETADQKLMNQATQTSVYAEGTASGLSAHTAKMKAFLMSKFGITNVGGIRGDDDGTGHGHSSGLALDFMIPVGDPKGDEMAQYLADNFEELGTYYIIYEQKYYMNRANIYGPANRWNLMDDRGSLTANHFDHIHVSFEK